MSTSHDALTDHVATAERLIASLRPNAVDLERYGGHNDQEAAWAADNVRNSVVVGVAVLIQLLEKIDAALLAQELVRSRRDPVDVGRAPIKPDPELRRAADRLRERVLDYLREEPTIVDAANQQVNESRIVRLGQTPAPNP
jgi:hypothetical protein